MKNANKYIKLIDDSFQDISNVVVTEGSTEYILTDNFLIRTNRGNQLQLLVSQANIEFREVEDIKTITILGEYENINQIGSQKIDIKNEGEKLIKSVVEVWSGSNDDGFLFLTGFFDINEELILSFCFGADEMVLVFELQEFWRIINQHGRYNRITLLHW
jgi:hypothetical protein